MQPILLADDDANGAFLTTRALKQAGVMQPTVLVQDGNAAVDYLAGAAAAATLAFSPAAIAQQQKLKIGFITTLAGPTGGIGKHMKDSVEIALDHLNRKVGGLETEVIFGDDQQKPDVGVQVAEEM